MASVVLTSKLIRPLELTDPLPADDRALELAILVDLWGNRLIGVGAVIADRYAMDESFTRYHLDRIRDAHAEIGKALAKFEAH